MHMWQPPALNDVNTIIIVGIIVVISNFLLIGRHSAELLFELEFNIGYA